MSRCQYTIEFLDKYCKAKYDLIELLTIAAHDYGFLISTQNMPVPPEVFDVLISQPTHSDTPNSRFTIRSGYGQAYVEGMYAGLKVGFYVGVSTGTCDEVERAARRVVLQIQHKLQQHKSYYVPSVDHMMGKDPNTNGLTPLEKEILS